MTYNQLLKFYKLLADNPNVGKLSNQSKIKFIRAFKTVKDEINVLIEAEKAIFEKYNIDNSDGKADFSHLDDDTKKEFVKEFNGLHDSDCPEIAFQLSESDFNILSEEKTVNQKDGSKFDFVYNAEELEFLFNYINVTD